MVMYTVELQGSRTAQRQVTLEFATNEGGQRSKGESDATGIAYMWGPWSSDVSVFVDDRLALEHAPFTERPADRLIVVKLE